MRIIYRILANSIAIYAATLLVPGFYVIGGWTDFLLAGLALGLLNFFVKPILKLVSFPMIVLTLGLFLIIINAIVIWLLGVVFSFVVIDNLISLMFATIIIAVANQLLYSFMDSA